MSPDAARLRLRDLIRERSMRTGRFRLASGRESTVLFDLKATLLHPEGGNLVADLLLDRIEADPATHIGGLEMGGVLIVQALCIRSVGRRERGFFFVRKAAKEHGTRNRIDGTLPEGSAALIVEDVTTTGGSVMQAVDAVRGRGASVATIVTILDREEGAAENLAREGLTLVSLFRKGEFLEEPDETSAVPGEA